MLIEIKSLGTFKIRYGPPKFFFKICADFYILNLNPLAIEAARKTIVFSLQTRFLFF